MTDEHQSPTLQVGSGAQTRKTLSWKKAREKAYASLPSALLLLVLAWFSLASLRLRDVYPMWFWTIIGFLLPGSFGSILLWSRLEQSMDPKKLSNEPSFEDSKYLENVVHVWSQVISVQMHFNEMLMRTRNYALTLVLAVVGGAAVALEKEAVVTIGDRIPGLISLATLLLLLGVAGLLAFYALDRFYYHPLLVGAVYKGREIEDWAFSALPAIDLSGVITTHSRIKVGSVTFYARNKLTVFYLSIGILLACSAMLVRDNGIPRGDTAIRFKTANCKIPIAGDTLSLVSTGACEVSLPMRSGSVIRNTK